MSILPSEDLASSKSDHQTPPTLLNNRNHGGGGGGGGTGTSSSSSSSSLLSSSPASSSQQHPPTTHAHPHSSASSVSHNSSGSLAPPADHSGRSSKKVNHQKSWSPRVEASPSTHQNGGKYSHHETGNSSAMDTPPSTRAQGSSSSKHSAAAAAVARKSQGVSGNHLLNFHYDPISRPQPRSRAPPPPARQPKRKPYNKDLFLQANYKFVVLDTGNYNPESMDPDKMLRWEDIICFKYLSPFPVHCPICLGDPLCPQITSCGHIFCFPCIMQYFLMDQDDHKGECWNKCPLCFTMISSQDLYTIYIENVKQYSVGHFIEFVLLSRKKDLYTLSLKNNEGVCPDEQVLDYFSKFTLTSDVELSVRQAMSDLDSWLARADSGLVDDLEKLPYVCAAMEQLEKRKKFWNEHRIPDVNKDVSVAGELVKVSQSSKLIDKSPLFGKSPQDKINGKSHAAQTADVVEQSEDHDGSSSSSYDDNTNTLTDGLRDRNDRDSYSFYQAIDGQLIILHSINMKCLLHHHGTYDKLPNRICGKILQLETVTQSETTRKRFRYLSHFSLTTTFQLCEIDLREVLPANAFSPFMDEIKNREKQRKQLARKERQEKIKAEAVGLDLVPVPYNVAQSSFDDSPPFSMDDFEALGSSNVTSSSPPAFGGRQLFSSVARLGFAAGHDSPALKIEESQSLPQVDVSGPLNTGTRSFASITSTAKPDEGPDKSKTNESGKKGRKPSRVLLSNTGGRRY